METFNPVFEIIEAKNCPLYENGDRMSLTAKTFSCPQGKEVCLILVRDMTQLLFVMLGAEDAQKSDVSTEVYSCSGCTGLIKFRQIVEHVDIPDDTVTQMRAIIQDANGDELVSDFLQSIPDDKMAPVMQYFQKVAVPHGTLLVRQGEPNHNLYLIIAGVFDIECCGRTIATLRQGEIFGEMSYLGVEQAVAAVRSCENSLVLAITAGDFGKILSSAPSVQLYMAKLLAARLQQVNAARTRDFESAMTGRLNEVVPAELFQVFHMHKKTGVLEMNLVDGEARVSFREGCLINAVYGEKKNQDAIFAMLAEKDGFYRFNAGLSPQEMKAAEIGDFMALLMEGVRRVDEVSGR
ncbi:DUF4388 domain-containing protein [Desulfopila sp. IMCC35008]|uniref:DUF4388 domain-containing protein n=1 Tax=Desulfopila sp. IMCC35008 TaxID=2653858 RepID=UPI0013D4DBE9|nr:DUF4388 domain-containing protein [Desulfopila sp. IMCC35008]